MRSEGSRHATSARHRSHRSSASQFQTGFDRPAVEPTDLVAEAAILLCLVATPFVFGGRGPYGAMTFQVTTLLAAIVVAGCRLLRRERWAWHPVDAATAAFAAVVALQLMPLPVDWVATLAPVRKELLPLWGSDATLPEWTTISFAPWQTSRQLGFVLCGGLLLVTIRQQLGRPGTVDRLAKSIAALGLVMATFALLQYLAGNGLYYWVYESPYQDTTNGTKGPFINTNHFGGFCVQTLPATLWLLLRPADPTRRHDQMWRAAAAFGTLALLAAIVLSGSRAGLVGIVVASTAWLVLHRRERLSAATVMIGLLTLTVGTTAVLAVMGSELETQVEDNVNSLATTDLERLDQQEGRRRIWGITRQGIEESPVLGTGLGSHASLYHRFWDGLSTAKSYSHVENGPLQATLETGLVGFAIVAAGLLAIGMAVWRRLRDTELPIDRALFAVPVAMLAANLVHTQTDFVWHTPGCMVLVLFAAAAATARYRNGLPATNDRERSDGQRTNASQQGGRFSRYGSIACVAAVVAVAATIALPMTARQWQAEQGWVRHVKAMKASSVKDRSIVDLRLRTIRQAATADPTDPRILERDARSLLQAFDREQRKRDKLDYASLRDAVRAGGFESPQQVREWLLKDGVAGENVKLLAAARVQAKRALAAQPAAPGMYVLLAQTNFLDVVGDDPRIDIPLYEQALAVDPTEAATHFELGRELMRLNEFDAALAHWKTAFTNDYRYQKRIGLFVARYVPADQFIEVFEPDWAALTRLRTVYRVSGRPEGEAIIVAALAEHWEQQATQVEPINAVHCCTRAYNCYSELERYEDCERVARDACRYEPNLFASRLLLGRCLYRQGDFAEALPHLTWAAKQKPDNEPLQVQAKTCLRKSLQSERPDAAIRQVSGP